MTSPTSTKSSPQQIAKQLVEARLNSEKLETYPGDMPTDLPTAYAIQDAAIDLWPSRQIGWKVGGLNTAWSDKLGVSRLVGAVFEENSYTSRGEEIPLPVFKDGFAAIEGEVSAKIGRDTPPEKTTYSTQEALDYIEALYVSIEIASSPFEGINDHGPFVTISDFGNNRGLVLGQEIPYWKAMALQKWLFETRINNELIGTATPDTLLGGPLESVRYALENIATRGRPAKAGTLILTGAITGVHRAYVGDTASVSCTGTTPIRCKLTAFPAT